MAALLNAKMKVSRRYRVLDHIVPGDVLQCVERGVGEGGGAGLVPHHQPAQVRGQAEASSSFHHHCNHYFYDIGQLLSLRSASCHTFLAARAAQ